MPQARGGSRTLPFRKRAGQGLQRARGGSSTLPFWEEGRPRVAKGPGRLQYFTISEKGRPRFVQSTRRRPYFTVRGEGRPRVAKGPGRLPYFTISEEGRPKDGSRTLPFRRGAGQGLQNARGGSGNCCKGPGAAPVFYRFGGGPAKGCKGPGAVSVSEEGRRRRLPYFTVSENGRPRVVKGPGRFQYFTISEEGRRSVVKGTRRLRRKACQGLQRTRAAPVFHFFEGSLHIVMLPKYNPIRYPTLKYTQT
jgi:hypothetical protein